MRSVVDHPGEERLGLDPLAHEPALHVGDRDDQGVDPAVADHPLQLLEPGMVAIGMGGVIPAVIRRGHWIPPSRTRGLLLDAASRSSCSDRRT